MKEINNQHLNSSESNRKKSFSQKTKDFTKKVADAVEQTLTDAVDTTKKTLTGLAIAGSTLLPASFETIAPTAAKVVAVPTAAALVTACQDDLDTTPPRIDIVQKNLEIQWWETLRISGNQVYVWNTLIFRCSDDVSSSINISATFNWKAISSWYTFNESGTLSIKATDEAWNVSNASSQVNKKEVADEIKFTVLKSQVDFSKWWKTSIKDKAFFVWNEKVVTWTDDNYTPSLKFDGKDVEIGYVVENEWVLTFTLTNDKWVFKSTNINTVNGNEAPEIQIKRSEANIFWWVKITLKDNQLLFWNVVMAEWTDDNTENLHMKFEADGKEIKSWETLNISTEWTHTWKLTATDDKNKSSTKEIKLENNVNKVVSGLDNLNNLNMQTDQEVNLLNGISFNWVELTKVEVEINWQRQQVSDPKHYTPNSAWTCKIIFTVKWEFGNSGEIKSKELTIKWIEYQSVTINNIDPESLVPKVEIWDKNVYKHIEHLRVPESTRIRDMMRKYGTGKYSPEEYQQLMNRLNTWMIGENPLWYDNYESIWWSPVRKPSEHAHWERFTLNEFIKHANFKVINTSDEDLKILYELCKKHPEKIFIMWSSVWGDVKSKDEYKLWNPDWLKEYDKEKNYLVFDAWWNIWEDENWVLLNKIYQEDYKLSDEHSVYSNRSRAHNKTDNMLDRHIMITFWTNKNGDIDQTNERWESSKFPVWFHNKILFSWRALPHRNDTWDKIRAATWKYATSHTNYGNVIMSDLIFQIKADVKDIDELLDMIKSTALTDYIRFDLNGDGDTNDNIDVDTNDNIDGQPETQPLQLINPAGVFKKYCMITNIPSTVKAWEIITLTKWRYLWLVFDIPWAEVKINWQRVAYNKSNESLIKSQNPMNLEWRINSNEAMKYGKKNLKWKIIVVDDQWNGLNMDKEISININ